MAATYGFHPDALFEYAEATAYYLREASPRVAEGFISAVESAISAFVSAPTRWRVVEEPEIRRYVFSRFPFVIYYRWEPQHERVTIYAVMHCSREPDYWHHRIDERHR
jgi:plasmid stabilization system protein ParE